MKLDNIKKRVNAYKEISLEINYGNLDELDLILSFWILLYRYRNNEKFLLCLKYFSKLGEIIFDELDMEYMHIKDYLKEKIEEIEDGNIVFRDILFYINSHELDKCVVDEKVQLVLEIVKNTTQRTCRIYYNSNLIKSESISYFIKNYDWFLRQININKFMKINSYEIVCMEEKAKIKFFNNREIRCYYRENFIQKFSRKLKNIQDKIAVVYGSREYTYKETNNMANKVAAIICNSEKKYIGVYSENDVSTVVAILAILKAGKCIVTINPSYPEKRVKKIINDLNMDTILCCDKIKNKFLSSTIDSNLLSVENIDYTENYSEICECVSKEEPCYIIFTSGTTGEPKGVIISQENIMLEIEWLIQYFSYNQFVKSLHILSYSFDFGLYDFLSTLMCGGTLFCIDKNSMKNFSSYIDFINNNEINNINVTPSFFNIISSFGKCLPSLKYVHLGGEKVTYRHIEKFNKVLNKECQIYNGYGPCECTVGCLIHEVTKEEREGEIVGVASVPIGKPTDESYIYILDSEKNIVPINAIGEIYVVGKSVGMGYVNESYNIRKFLEYDGKKAFATGDMAKWLTNGEVEFLNRKDTQIKINGFRVELSEIDVVIEGIEAVEAAKTVYNGKLITFVVLRRKIPFSQVRAEISKMLPYYMIPTKFVELEAFPCLESGKIDVQKLEKMI